MHIVANRLQISTAAPIDEFSLIASTEQMSKFFVPTVKPAGVSAQEPLHALDEVRLRRLDDHVEMIFS